MKIIQVNVVADRGSTGKICACIDEMLNANGCESLICYGRKSAASNERRYGFGSEWEAALSKVANRCGRLMYAASEIGTSRLIRRLRSEKPDIVHLHCINGYCVNIYRLLHFLADAGIATVVTHHAEFFYTGNCGHALECSKFTATPGCGGCPCRVSATGAMFTDRSRSAWLRMKEAFARFAPNKLVFTAVSPWVRERSLESGVVEGRHCVVVENGLDTEIFNARTIRDEGRALIPGCKEKVVLHVSASFSDATEAFKGGAYVVEMARRMTDVSFVVAASYTNIVSELPKNIHIHGKTKSQEELAALYRAANATLIASRRETFSMVVAESLCCGTPVVGFKAGGPESIAITPYCKFVEQGDIDALERELSASLTETYDRDEISRKALAKFNSKTMTNNYIEVYRAML